MQYSVEPLGGSVDQRMMTAAVDALKRSVPVTTKTHGPLSSAEVLQSTSGSLQGVKVLALGQQRQVESHHLRLIEQLETCGKGPEARESLIISEFTTLRPLR